MKCNNCGNEETFYQSYDVRAVDTLVRNYGAEGPYAYDAIDTDLGAPYDDDQEVECGQCHSKDVDTEGWLC